MNRIATVSFLSILLILPLVSLSAQESGVPESSDESVQTEDEGLEVLLASFERLLDEALTAAENSDWEKAHTRLDEAEQIFSDDPRIADYRTSFNELAALEIAQTSWSDGTPAEVEDPETNNPSDEETGVNDEEPRFAIDRGDLDPKESPVLTRDNLRVEFGLKTFSVDPTDNTAKTNWSSGNEFLYSSIGVDVAYWLPFAKKSLGLNFRNSGYSFRPGEPTILFNSLDLGLNIRGFIAESKTSRLEVGLDFGGTLQSTHTVGVGTDQNWALFLGLWGSDPLLYHLFQADSLENLVFGGGIRIYSSLSDEIFEMLNYRFDVSWVMKGWHVGARLEWWDLVISDERQNMMSLSFLGGYRF